MERFLREHGAEVLPEDRRAALLLTYVRNNAALAYRGDLCGAAGFGWSGLMHARRPSDLRAIAQLAAILTRHAIRHGLSKPSS